MIPQEILCECVGKTRVFHGVIFLRDSKNTQRAFTCTNVDVFFTHWMI
jgi:hypothetical protein